MKIQSSHEARLASSLPHNIPKLHFVDTSMGGKEYSFWSSLVHVYDLVVLTNGITFHDLDMIHLPVRHDTDATLCVMLVTL